jgi:hypothetical protein
LSEPAHRQTPPLTFIVGSARCGSTMLSLILHEHPEVLSLSEFLTAMKSVRHSQEFPAGDMDGRQFWDMLSAQSPLPASLARDADRIRALQAPGPRYVAGTGRFGHSAGVPLIAKRVLPMLTSDPDTLFDQLAAQVPRWPLRPAADQYLALFGLLAGLLGRRVVIERSGGSLRLVRLLHEQFPAARFVHLYRDGPDCALSMSRHITSRRAELTAEAARLAGLPPTAGWDQVQQALPSLPPEFSDLLGWPFDLDKLMAYPIPLRVFGQRWSRVVCDGLAALRELPAALWTSASYEDLLTRPREELARLAAFAGVAAPDGWLAAAQRLAEPGRAGRAGRLSPADLAELRDACRPGTEAIAAAGSPQPSETVSR